MLLLTVNNNVVFFFTEKLKKAEQKLERCKKEKSVLTVGTGQDTDAAEAEQEALLNRNNLLKKRDNKVQGLLVKCMESKTTSSKAPKVAKATVPTEVQATASATLSTTTPTPPVLSMPPLQSLPAVELPVAINQDSTKNRQSNCRGRSYVEVDMPPALQELIGSSETIGKFLMMS